MRDSPAREERSKPSERIEPAPRLSYDRRWLRLLLDITTIANEASSLETGLTAALGKVCRHNGWYAGYCDLGDRRRGVWWRENAEEDDGRSDAAIPPELEDLARNWARRVMETARTQQVEDFAGSRQAALELPGVAPGRGGAVACPLLAGARPVGAMVFFSRHPLSSTLAPELVGDLLEVLHSIGTQMGRVLERWHLLRRIDEEAEEEREALGREIHDGIAQRLVGARLLAQNLRRRTEGAEDGSREQWDLLIENLLGAQAQARALARGLSAVALMSDSDTLVEQLQELKEVVSVGHGVRCELEVRGAIEIEDKITRAHLFRIAREAVMNALRHGKPSCLVILLSGDGERLGMEIRDDGTGFDAESGFGAGMGLRGMRYRAEAIGARLEIESEPGAGTVVRCSL